MIYVVYLCVAAGLTFLSIKAADYVDLIDKKTSLSGAFIGGVMLSAVTSLPEMFTSISSTLMLKQPGLCMGNILGSDLFNMLILAVLALVFFKTYSKADISKSHLYVLGTILVGYVAILLNMLGILKIEILTVSINSLIIFVCYGVSFKHLSGEEGEASDEDDSRLTLKQVIIRFVLVSIGIIALSIVISYVTDEISDKLNLGKGIAGALFMGIATSLPELASSVALFKKKNFDIAAGNMIGSNIFNMAILALTDVLYIKGGVYDFSDPKTVNLIYFGIVGTVLLFAAIKIKKNWVKVCGMLGIIACYVCFLFV